jgi:hypothetical protein
MTDSKIEDLVQNIDTISSGVGVTLATLPDICIRLMQIAEKFPKMSGAEKKQVVMQAISVYIDRKGADNIVMGVVSSFIDIAVSLSKGEIHIGKNRGCTGCF